MSPESTSSLFPERPIRPLPKRRLRERLSPDVADSIQYPPAPQATAPLFAYPYNPKDESSTAVAPPTDAGRENVAKFGSDARLRRNGVGYEREDDNISGHARRALGSRAHNDYGPRAQQRPGPSRQVNAQAPPSTASSADGYDSFENTNNKKKRKIPTAGETVLNGTHVLHDSAAFGVPSPPTTGDEGSGDVFGSTSTPYYQSHSATASGQGISGPGRGRFGRARNGRSPLRTLSDSIGNWGARNFKLRPGGQVPSPPAENSGIISTAIASAEKLPIPEGQENISLLQHQATTKPTPASSAQFTFTFDSQNPVSWPGSDPASSMPGGATSRTHQSALPAEYGSGNGRGSQPPPGPAVPGAASGGHRSTEGSVKGTTSAPSGSKKPKRRVNSLVQAAKQRRKETEYQNLHHPPPPEDRWICEFCEYEMIFGRPPEALIRQYEIKDRRRRREEAERRRLLEKAKMKSRKGKKASKAPAKNSAASGPDRNPPSSNDHHAPPPPPPPPPPDHEGEEFPSEFESEDNYEDDVNDDIPPLAPQNGYHHTLSAAQPHGIGVANNAGRGQVDIRA
ncbi:hypothetical protein F4780DRAFT_771126 [Xylariomycetidae sp. FL0641]|nr:hypothetical protein F4780DRAFT_771126 [Xylariomycetidae sp. FL0641]